MAASEVVSIRSEERDFPFQVYETMNKQFVPRRWRFSNTYYSEQNDLSEEPMPTFTSISGRTDHFRKYIPNCDHTSLRLDFCFETHSGRKKW